MMCFWNNLCLNFQANNNLTEYEALLAGMRHFCKVGATHLKVMNESQLVILKYL